MDVAASAAKNARRDRLPVWLPTVCRAANAGLRPDPTAAGVATVPRTRSHCDSIADGKAGCVCHADRSSPASAHERCRAAAKAAALDTWIEPELFRDGDHGALVDRVEHEDHFVGAGRIEFVEVLAQGCRVDGR